MAEALDRRGCSCNGRMCGGMGCMSSTSEKRVPSEVEEAETRGYLIGHREMSDYHTAAMKDAYELLGIDGSDGEYRYKWVAMEISKLKSLMSKCRQIAEWHMGDGDECGTLSREVLAELDRPPHQVDE